MRKVKVAAVQMACGSDKTQNINKAETFVREAAKRRYISLTQELLKLLIFVKRSYLKFMTMRQKWKTTKQLSVLQGS